LAATPVKVNPAFGVRVIVAVYTFSPAKVPTTSGAQVMVPVY